MGQQLQQFFTIANNIIFVLMSTASVDLKCIFPAHARSAWAGPKIVLVPPYLYIYIYLFVRTWKIIMPFIHVVLEECTP